MKQTIRSNHRITVTPSSRVGTGYGMFTASARVGTLEYSDAMDERCKEMREDILRHVDHLPRDSGNGGLAPGAVRIECDSRDECSFCGRLWEELIQEMIDSEGLEFWAESPDTLDIDGPGLPLCCPPAQDEWRAAKRVSISQGTGATRVEQ